MGPVRGKITDNKYLPRIIKGSIPRSLHVSFRKWTNIET